MADGAWAAVLRRSAAAQGWTWLHHLHLCVVLKQAGPPYGTPGHTYAALSKHQEDLNCTYFCVESARRQAT